MSEPVKLGVSTFRRVYVCSAHDVTASLSHASQFWLPSILPQSHLIEMKSGQGAFSGHWKPLTKIVLATVLLFTVALLLLSSQPASEFHTSGISWSAPAQQRTARSWLRPHPSTAGRASHPPSKWAVFSTRAAVTPIMQRIAAMDDWNVVVVAETFSAQPWSWPNITYLSLEQQNNLGYNILEHLPKQGPRQVQRAPV